MKDEVSILTFYRMNPQADVSDRTRLNINRWVRMQTSRTYNTPYNPLSRDAWPLASAYKQAPPSYIPARRAPMCLPPHNQARRNNALIVPPPRIQAVSTRRALLSTPRREVTALPELEMPVPRRQVSFGSLMALASRDVVAPQQRATPQKFRNYVASEQGTKLLGSIVQPIDRQLESNIKRQQKRLTCDLVQPRHKQSRSTAVQSQRRKSSSIIPGPSGQLRAHNYPTLPLGPFIPSPGQATNRDGRFTFNFLLNPMPSPHNERPRFKNRGPSRKAQFHDFSDEVRGMIWDYARGRTITIIIKDNRIFSRSPSPITFRINKESRGQCLDLYRAYFGFYISSEDDNENSKIPYPYFDPEVDSVVLMNQTMGSNTGETIYPFDLYGAEANTRKHLNIIHSLYIPSQAWDWDIMTRGPRDLIRFGNLTEIVFQGGDVGLVTPGDMEKCKNFVRGCFEKTAEVVSQEENDEAAAGLMSLAHGGTVVGGKRNLDIKVPVVRIIMKKGLDYEWKFARANLGVQMGEDQSWMSFIKKVKDDRR